MLTASRLRRLISCDKASGLLRWRESLSHRVRVGDIAGSINADGAVIVTIAGRKFVGHRLAVQICTGAWPKNNIRHRDGNKSNNRWRNIRAA